jgi:hypothetical protein
LRSRAEGEGEMTSLALRSIGSNDYAVIDDGYTVGRTMLAAIPALPIETRRIGGQSSR